MHAELRSTGMMFPMPSDVTPPGMTEDVVRAVEMMGSHIRTQLLHELTRATRPLGTPELVAAVGASRIATRENLHALEELGLIQASHPPEDRAGRKVEWTADTPRVRELADRWREYICPPEGSPSA